MKKLKQHTGFTLAELLIVVAVIAVLVAISIPIFNTQLRKARLATNMANARAAYSAAMVALIGDPELTEYLEKQHQNDTGAYCSFFYDVSKGECIVITYNNQGDWKDGTEEWLDYNKNPSNPVFQDWTVDTQGDNKKLPALGDKIYSRWKIDLYKDCTVKGKTHTLGELMAICWKE